MVDKNNDYVHLYVYMASGFEVVPVEWIKETKALAKGD